MTTPVSGSRAGEVHPSLDELAGAQGAAPASGSTPGARTAASKESNTVTRAPASPAVASAPREFPTGTMDYYRKRHFDFVDRNPGAPPPPYYLQYGDKYVQRFAALGSNDLSPQGLVWRDRALKGLQKAMEDGLKEGAADFAKLERRPDDFRIWAYKTHVNAYLDAGLLELPAQDLATILFTPDFKDLLNKEGLDQVLEVLKKLHPDKIAAITAATAGETARPAFEQMDRELKALMLQSWITNGN
ncbi:hypothetical protein JRI60_27820 [Archangium violaceum]|uniref:hypothetical protein n=1 Tax=Archangium violaceum TaxID=83451 RepID=UPI001952587F|nr:hypothetical protein [Archangium violaceum]QRN93015.1 hypothetical protein JRI60_27820 [Archangium violaceum]